MNCKICSPNLEFPEIPLKQYPNNPHNLFSYDSYAVAVNYWIYDKKRKRIINSGSSRPCGLNHSKSSIHAEERAINYCRKTKNKNLEIFIWRWGKKGNIKPAYCCKSCTQLVEKYGYENIIFTFDNDIKVSSVIDNPSLSLAYKIKYGLEN